MTHFIYVLVSLKDGKSYVGQTNHLLRRYRQHAEGFVASTRNRRPLVMAHWEEFPDKKQAMQREKTLKSPMSAEFKQALRDRINTL